MSVKECIAQELDNFSETELLQVAEYLAFLKFRARTAESPQLDETQIAALYAEFADEDRQLAEEGIADYEASLQAEDVQPFSNKESLPNDSRTQILRSRLFRH